MQFKKKNSNEKSTQHENDKRRNYYLQIKIQFMCGSLKPDSKNPQFDFHFYFIYLVK